MTLKKYEELKEINLKGYCYYEDAWGMTMTSRHAYTPELWVVIEDEGETCTVARYNNDSNYVNALANVRLKDYVAKQIHRSPCINKENSNFVQEFK